MTSDFLVDFGPPILFLVGAAIFMLGGLYLLNRYQKQVEMIKKEQKKWEQEVNLRFK